MFLSARHAICAKMHRTAADDEQICLICLKPLSQQQDIDGLFLQEEKMCRCCRKKLIPSWQIYQVNGIKCLVLFEYDLFLERLFFQFKEGPDPALAPVFVHGFGKELKRIIKNRQILCMPGWWEKSLERGFEPMDRILESIGLTPSYPFVKTEKVKQSSQTKKDRESIQTHIALKDLAWIEPDAIFMDDVLTTGSTLLAACQLSHVRSAIVLAAHPLWLEEHEKDRIKRGHGFQSVLQSL